MTGYMTGYMKRFRMKNGKENIKRIVRPAAVGRIMTVVLMAVVLLFTAALNTYPVPQDDGSMILVDKIAAVVQDQIITLTDIDKAIRFYPNFRKPDEAETDFYNRILEDLINYRVIYLHYRNDFVLKEEDYDQVQREVIKKLGSYNGLMSQLKSYDMEWSDFQLFIRDRVVYEMVVKNQLRRRISIPFKEIEAFYNKEYLPRQKQLNLQPLSLYAMAPQIENHLKTVRAQEKLATWLKELRTSYKIENKLSGPVEPEPTEKK